MSNDASSSVPSRFSTTVCTPGVNGRLRSATVVLLVKLVCRNPSESLINSLSIYERLRADSPVATTSGTGFSENSGSDFIFFCCCNKSDASSATPVLEKLAGDSLDCVGLISASVNLDKTGLPLFFSARSINSILDKVWSPLLCGSTVVEVAMR